MHEKIKDIQNTIWIIFREFEETHDMEKYNQRAAELVHKYKEDELCTGFQHHNQRIHNLRYSIHNQNTNHHPHRIFAYFFLLDNLMTALDLDVSGGYDKYDRQSLFVKNSILYALP